MKLYLIKLAQAGAQLMGALAAVKDPASPASAWIERDPVSGASLLKIPMPPPETAERLANAFAALAGVLRGKQGQ